MARISDLNGIAGSAGAPATAEGELEDARDRGVDSVSEREPRGRIADQVPGGVEAHPHPGAADLGSVQPSQVPSPRG